MSKIEAIREENKIKYDDLVAECAHIEQEIKKIKQALKQREEQQSELEGKIKSLLPKGYWFTYDIDTSWKHPKKYSIKEVSCSGNTVYITVKEVFKKKPWPTFTGESVYHLEKFAELNIYKTAEELQMVMCTEFVLSVENLWVTLVVRGAINVWPIGLQQLKSLKKLIIIIIQKQIVVSTLGMKMNLVIRIIEVLRVKNLYCADWTQVRLCTQIIYGVWVVEKIMTNCPRLNLSKMKKIIKFIKYKIKQHQLCPKCIGMHVVGNFGPCTECENFNKYKEYVNYEM